MDITKSNLKENIADIKSAISNACFLAIDCEFSGLNIDSESNVNAYDSYEQYYLKLKRNVNKFLVFQFGLCAFKYDETLKQFKQKCYNFYLFPRPTNKAIPDHRFLCQASSMDFLANHDFNFNKVFKEGITYLNKIDEEKFKEILEEKLKTKVDTTTSNNNSNIIPIPDDDKPFVNDIMTMIEKFLSNNNDELMLPTCNSFRRRLIYQTAREKFKSKVTLETRISENKDRVLYVLKPETPEQIAEKEQLKYELNLAELEDAVGFSRVIQFISESEKLIIGHNLCLDLLHIIDKFLIPLPDCYEEFKNCASCLFPNIIDTKILASISEFKDLIDNTILSGLVNTFKTRKVFELPEIVVDKNSEGYILDDDKQHEAGYDAYMTGVCFLTMARYLDDSNNYFSITSEVLKPYLNKIFTLKLQDCGYLNLSGPDPKPSRDHVLHITFPKDWKTSDLIQLFSPFGNIHIAWINENSAYVALYKRDQAAVALSNLSQSGTYKLISYARHQTIINAHPYSPLVQLPTQAAKKKREQEFATNFQTKKRRRDLGESIKTSFSYLNDCLLKIWFLNYIVHIYKLFRSSKPKFNTIAEEPEDATDSIATRMTKMFDETSAWD